MPYTRIIIAFILVALGYCSFANSVGAVTELKNPDVALNLDPSNARAKAFKAELLAAKDPRSVEAHQLAKESLQRLLINPIALRVYGMTSKDFNEERQRDFLRLAEKESRRDPMTQLTLLEEEARQNNVDAVLHRYERVLRTNAQSRGVLFERLGYALIDPGIRRSFAKIVKKDPDWMQAFVQYITESNVNVDRLALAIIDAGGFKKNQTNYDNFSQTILNKLANSGKYEIARDFFNVMDGSDPAMLIYVDLNAASTDQKFSPVSWRSWETVDGIAIFEKTSEEKFTVVASARQDTRTIVLDKILFLVPGKYNFIINTEFQSGGEDAELVSRVRCLPEKSIIGSLQISPGRTKGNLNFSIGPSCKTQTIEIELSGGKENDGVDVRIESMALGRQTAN